jgi:hypothetical protein
VIILSLTIMVYNSEHVSRRDDEGYVSFFENEMTIYFEFII